MFTIKASGNFKKTDAFLSRMRKREMFRTLDRFGREGVAALASATPVDSALSANSWSYEVRVSNRSASISWTNSNTVNGTPIVILLQYGHGTGTGGYVQGRDFINPSLAPIFNRIADSVWKEVTSA